MDIIRDALFGAKMALEQLLSNQSTLQAIEKAGLELAHCLEKKGRIFSCGNGGSMCDAMHFAEELSGRFREDRAPLPAIAIADPAHLSCVSNDFGYEQVFSRYIEAHGRPGDVLVGISTSGSSPNVMAALEMAHASGMRVIGLTGRSESPLGEKADVVINTPGGTKYSDRVQELHIKVIHILIEIVEKKLFS